MGLRQIFAEMMGLSRYKTESGKYFYAWSANHAIKKHPNEKLFIITEFGGKIHVGGTKNKRVAD